MENADGSRTTGSGGHWAGQNEYRPYSYPQIRLRSHISPPQTTIALVHSNVNRPSLSLALVIGSQVLRQELVGAGIDLRAVEKEKHHLDEDRPRFSLIWQALLVIGAFSSPILMVSDDFRGTEDVTDRRKWKALFWAGLSEVPVSTACFILLYLSDHLTEERELD